ncbi:MAG: YkgJ family cysteine cluster protein [Gammaproteobacteria bacterium]|nr:YkgJ family cysteine cluster protein [Gammaproteobacteria bacterium]
MSRSWWRDGVRFACQGSGRCCVSRGAYGYVYLTLEDRRRLAAILGMPTRQFTREHCAQTDGLFHLKETGPECRFLVDNRCAVYEGRPTQCRTWPFWPENMPARAWTAIAAFCPGVGKGAVIPAERIEAALDEQERSTAAL